MIGGTQALGVPASSGDSYPERMAITRLITPLLLSMMKKLRDRPPTKNMGGVLVFMILAVVPIWFVACSGSSDSAERIQQIEMGIEKASVQNSIDILMADAAVASIDANKGPGKAAVQKWTGLPKKGGRRITAGGAPVDLADYMGLDADKTKFWYCYDTDGRVLEQKTLAGNCS